MNGWEVKFKNFSAALQLLQYAVTEIMERSDLEKHGAIHRFTYSHELAWQVMKDYLSHEGIVGIIGSRSATREAFSKGLITDGAVWMKMLGKQKSNRAYLCGGHFRNRVSVNHRAVLSVISRFWPKNEQLSMSFGLNHRTLEQLRSVFGQYPEIEGAIIYGSRAKGNYREGSDIDLSMKGALLTDNIRSSVWLALDDLNLPFKIDLSVFDLLHSESLEEHIERVGISFYLKQTIHL